MDEVPSFLGGRLKGTIQTGVAIDKEPRNGFRLRLVCARKHSYRDKDGDKQVSTEEIWKTEQQVYGFASNKGPTLAIPLYFSIPEDLPPTHLIPENDRTLWRLDVSAQTEGINYKVQFEVPVYPKEPVGKGE